MSDLAPILQGFFRDKLMEQKKASPHTIASYKIAWQLLLAYAQHATGTPPSKMRLGQLDDILITGFLQNLETERGNSARTRNNRLAAIHSLFHYAELHAVDDAEMIRRVLAIDTARTASTDIPWLTPDQVDALLAAPDQTRWAGKRDHAMMTTLLATGLRVSELLSLTRTDAHVQATGSHVRCTGKGRKSRSTPLDPAATAVMKQWLIDTSGHDTDPLFPARGTPLRPLTRDAFQNRLAKYQAIAATTKPSLNGIKITPHVFRHTKAMNMRAAGHDISIIALWLGHENISSTTKYMHADLKLKEHTLERTTAPDAAAGLYQPTDSVLAFLDSL